MRFPSENLVAMPWAKGGSAARRRYSRGFVASFWEVLMGMVIVAIVFGSIIQAYLYTGLRFEWTGYSLAAQSLGVQTLEQARSAVWDIALGKNQITNLTLQASSWSSGTQTYSGYTTNILDVPFKGTNYVVATNYVTIQIISENNASSPLIQLQFIRVDTVWPFTGWGNFNVTYYTNTICTYIAPDNRDPSTLGVGG